MEQRKVANASSEEGVAEAEIKEMRARRIELDDLRFLLSDRQGRRFLWRLLERCRAFSSVWEPSARIHYNAGQQDLGHYLIAEIMQANEDAFLKMMKEAKGDLENV